MRSIEEHRRQIEARGVRIVAVSVDPPDVTREHISKQGYNYLFLSDEKHEVLRRWDLVHPGAFRGADIARPAEFLLDPKGVVRWVNLTESYQVRPKGEQILDALDQAGVPAAAPAAAEAASIRNFLRLNEKICTGAQPTLEQLAALEQDGVRAVINLRRPSEYDHATEEETVRALGMRYVNIPVDTNAPRDDQVEEFLRITSDQAHQPAFIHCGSANRVGAFWLVRRVLVDGWRLEDAVAEAERIGMRRGPAREFALDYLRRHQKRD